MSTDQNELVAPPPAPARKSRLGLYLLGGVWVACWGLVLAQLVT
jgi:hypothetical protein